MFKKGDLVRATKGCKGRYKEGDTGVVSRTPTGKLVEVKFSHGIVWALNSDRLEKTMVGEIAIGSCVKVIGNSRGCLHGFSNGIIGITEADSHNTKKYIKVVDDKGYSQYVYYKDLELVEPVKKEELKIGDKVIVNPDIRRGETTKSLIVVDDMIQHAGTILTISRIYNHKGRFGVNENDWNWDDTITTPISDVEANLFHKSQLKPFMRVEYRNGDFRVYIEDGDNKIFANGKYGYMLLSRYSDTLTIDGDSVENDCDIVAVYEKPKSVCLIIQADELGKKIWDSKNAEKLKEIAKIKL